MQLQWRAYLGGASDDDPEAAPLRCGPRECVNGAAERQSGRYCSKVPTLGSRSSAQVTSREAQAPDARPAQRRAA
jgi:hypothetical protein